MGAHKSNPPITHQKFSPTFFHGQISQTPLSIYSSSFQFQQQCFRISLFWFFSSIFVLSMAVSKGKYIKLQPKKWSTFQLSKMIMALVFVLGFVMLLALRFFSPPETSHRNLPHRLASSAIQPFKGTPETQWLWFFKLVTGINWFWFWYFCCCYSSDGLGKRGDQWVEFISWEPRAFVYHNFLVSFLNCGFHLASCLILSFFEKNKIKCVWLKCWLILECCWTVQGRMLVLD